MSANTLVTKLKGSVQNDNLPELGKISFRAVKKETISRPDNQQTIMLQFKSGENRKIKVVPPGAVGFDPATVDQSTDTELVIGTSYVKVAFKNESYKITIDKYLLSSFVGRAASGAIGIFDVNLEQFSGAPQLEYLNVARFTKATGSVMNLADCPLIECKLTDNAGINGDLIAFAECTGLTTLSLAWTSVRGEINDLAAAQVANGRTSGTLSITTSAYITLNGVAVDENIVKTITFDSSLPNGYSVS